MSPKFILDKWYRGGGLNCMEIVTVNTKNATVLWTVLWTTLGLLRSVDGEPLWHASTLCCLLNPAPSGDHALR